MKTVFDTLAHPLSPWRLLPRLVLTLRPKPTGRGLDKDVQWPLVVTQRECRIHKAHLQRYRYLCGWTETTVSVPLTYPHLLAFPLQLQLLTDRRFPLALPGTVHLANTITQWASLQAGDTLTARVTALAPEDTERGQVFSLRTEMWRDETLVWEGTSTLLQPMNRPRRPGVSATSVPGWQALDHWTLPANLGRRYALLSGDCNPIHLGRWGARLFSRPQPIIHGMWTCARALAALPIDWTQLPVRLEVTFRRPVPLPSCVALEIEGSLDPCHFQVVRHESDPAAERLRCLVGCLSHPASAPDPRVP